MRLDFPYRMVGAIDPSIPAQFQALVEPRDWIVYDYRKNMVGHTGVYESMVFRHSSEYSTATIKDMPLMGKYRSSIESMVGAMRNHYLIRDYTALASKLGPGSKVSPHTDLGEFLESIHRVHIPVVTNENSFYFVGDERVQMKVGEMYEIDNQRVHWVKNDGDTDRVHVIINIYGEPI
jgi:hypothetical protein